MLENCHRTRVKVIGSWNCVREVALAHDGKSTSAEGAL